MLLPTRRTPIPSWRRRHNIEGREIQRLWSTEDKNQAVCGLYQYGYEIAELAEGLNLSKAKVVGTLSSNEIPFRRIRNILPEEWEQKKAQYHYCCAYCGKRKNLERDHIIPLSAGGDDSMVNIVPACETCNRSKNKRDLLDWSKFRALQLSL